MPPKIYVAGPLGFSEPGKSFYYNIFLPTLDEMGFEVVDPWKLAPLERMEELKNKEHGLKVDEALTAWKEVNLEIGLNNVHLLDEVDGLVAILDGPDVDSGTAAEIGYFCGKHDKKRPIMGYRSDFRLSSENIGSIINLQVEQFIHLTGGKIVKSLEELKRALKKIFD